MRISDWSSDVCSSDLVPIRLHRKQMPGARSDHPVLPTGTNERSTIPRPLIIRHSRHRDRVAARTKLSSAERRRRRGAADANDIARSEEHTSELQSLMRISYAVFCLKKQRQDDTRDLRN